MEEDISYRCKNCEKYDLCRYYHNRKATSQICPKFKLEEEEAEWIVYETLHGYWEGLKKYQCSKCCEKVGVYISQFCPHCGKRMKNYKKGEMNNGNNI